MDTNTHELVFGLRCSSQVTRHLSLFAVFLLALSPTFVSAQSVDVFSNAHTNGAKPKPTPRPKPTPKPTPAPAPNPRDPFWDVTAGAGNGTGGSGTWSSQGQTIWSTTSAGDATLVAAGATDPGVFQGTAGTVLLGFSPTLASWTFNTTNYVLTPDSSIRTVTGPFSLAASVNLNLFEAGQTADRELRIAGSVSGGTGSTLTVQGAQTNSGNTARIDLAQAGASIDVPITISGTGTTSAGFVAIATGTGITGTITNNSSFKTLLGATSGNDLTLSSTAAIGGTGAVRIGISNTGSNVGTVTLNAASTYSGGTTLDGGTLALGNDGALGSGTLTLSNSGSSVLQAVGGVRLIGNNIIWGGNATISGSNAFTFNGSFTSSGAASRTMTVTSTDGLTLAGNVFLAESNTGRGLTINGTSAVTINGVITNNSGANTAASDFTYSGSNVLTLTNANTYTGQTTVNSGVLKLANANALPGGIGAAGGTGPLVLGGGVIGLAAGDFSRPLGTSSTNGAVNLSGGGGFAAYGADRIVNLGGASALVTWTSGNFISSSNVLILGASSADHTVDFQNPISLGTSGAAIKTIQVDDGSAAIDGKISGVISSGGTNGIQKTGAGMLALTAANTYTGTTTISAGTLQLGDGGTTGSLSTSSTISDNGNFAINQSDSVVQGTDFSGSAITGTGSITQSGSGSLTLNAANTYSGGTTLSAGTLRLGSSSTGAVTNGPVGTGTLTLNGGTLSSDSTTARSIANAITFGSDVTLGNGTNNGLLTLSGAGTLTGNRILTLNSDVTYSGNIGETGGARSLTKSGGGTLILSGNNTYSGGTTANDGLIQLRSSTALGSSSGSLTVNAGTANGAIVDLSGNSITVGNLTGTGTGIGGNIWNQTNVDVTLTIGNGNTGGGNYAGLIRDNNPGSGFTGKVSVTKTGSGTITLSGANDYTGATTVNGGTLFINGNQTNATGLTTVSNGGTVLGGTGTIGGTVTVNSAANILGGSGASTSGTLTVKGNLTMNSGSIIELALGPSGAHSTLALNGTPSFQLTQDFNFISLGATAGTYDNIITGVTNAPVTAGWTIDNPGWTGTFTWDGTNIDLNLIAVPEPSTWIAGGLALMAVCYTQRRRFARLLARA